jgi:hypothetical protein
VYVFNLCAVSLLSSTFTASALVWSYNLFKYLIFHFYISLIAVFICKFSWIQCLFMYLDAFRMDFKYFIWKTCFPQHSITPSLSSSSSIHALTNHIPYYFEYETHPVPILCDLLRPHACASWLHASGRNLNNVTLGYHSTETDVGRKPQILKRL